MKSFFRSTQQKFNASSIEILLKLDDVLDIHTIDTMLYFNLFITLSGRMCFPP